MLSHSQPHPSSSLPSSALKHAVQNYLTFTIDQISKKVALEQLSEPDHNQIMSENQRIPSGKHSQKNYKIAKSISITTMATGRQFLSEAQIKSAKDIQAQNIIHRPPVKKVIKCIKTQLQCSNFTLEFKGDFIESKYYFLKIASQNGFNVSRDTQTLLTVKKATREIFKGFLAVCLPVFNERAVYQLEYREETSSVKKIQLICVSGKDQEYQSFCQSLIFEYWKNNLIDLTDQQLAEILFLVDRKTFQNQILFCGKAVSHAAVKKLQSAERIEMWREQFVINVKRAEKKVLTKFYEENAQRRINKQTFEQQLKLCLFQNLGGITFYEEMNKEKTTEFFQKRKNILENTTLERVLQFLQIDFTGLHDPLSRLDSIDQSKIPFSTSVLILNNLSKDSPFSYNLTLIRKFCCEMAQAYYQHKKSLKINFQSQEQGDDDIFDMDTQLPVTIFCVLMSSNSEAHTITSFLSDYYQYEDNYGTENRILTAINAAFQFIRNEWPLERKESS